MSRKRGQFTEGYVNQVGQRVELQSTLFEKKSEGTPREERDVSVARTGIPPVQAEFVEVRRLCEGGEENEAGVGEQVAHFGNDAAGGWRVFHDLEAGDQVERPARAIGEIGKGIVGGSVETVLNQRARQKAVTTSEIEDGKRISGREKCFRDYLGVAGGSSDHVVGIDLHVVVVVDVGEESLGGPTVEFIGEGKSAVRAPAVVDGFAGEIQYFSLRFDATLVEIDHSEQGTRTTTDFAAGRGRIDDREHGISETDSLSGPQNDVVFRGDVVSFEKEGADGLLRQLAADDLFVIVRGQSHFGAFEHKIHVEIDRERRIGEMTLDPLQVSLPVKKREKHGGDDANMRRVVNEIVVAGMRSEDAHTGVGAADAVQLADHAEEYVGVRAHVFEGMEEEDFDDGVGFPGPGLRFGVENQIGMADGRLVYVEETGNGVEAAADVQFSRLDSCEAGALGWRCAGTGKRQVNGIHKSGDETLS